MGSVEGAHYIFDRYVFINMLLIEHFKKREILPRNDDARIQIQFDSKSLTLNFILGNEDGEPLDVSKIPDQVFLINPESDQKTVDKAIKLARFLYHPDQYSAETDSIKQTAERKREVIEVAAKILGNGKLRTLYNDRLIGFYAKDTRLVSFDGNAIVPIDLDSDFFDLDNILADEELDTSRLEDHIRTQLQYDEAQYENAKSLYEGMPDNDHARTIYKDALNKRHMFLDLIEDAAWAKIGFGEKKRKIGEDLDSANQYIALIQAEIERAIEEEVPVAVTDRNDALRIGTAEPPLLLTDQSGGQTEPSGLPAIMDAETTQKVTAKARKNMEVRAKYAIEIAQQKQEVMQQLVRLGDIKLMNERDYSDPNYTIVYVSKNKSDGKLVFIAGLICTAGIEGGNTRYVEGEEEQVGKELDEALSALPLDDKNVFLLIRNTQFHMRDMNMEITGAADVIFEDWEKNQPKPGVVARTQPRKPTLGS